MATYEATNKSNKDLKVTLTQAEKDWYESEGSPVKGKYTFRELQEDKTKAPAPVEAKKVSDEK